MANPSCDAILKPMKPEISVMIPTYNRQAVLPRALDSVLAQEGVIFEILVVDDGSTDDTAKLIKNKYPQVTYLSQSHQGPSAARNRGIEASRGEWIAFLDSDDEWKPGKLQAQLTWLAQHPDYKIMQTEEIWIRNGQRVNSMKKHQKYGGLIFEKCLPLCIVSPSAVIIRRDLFEEVGLFDESLPACEDYDLWLRIAAKHPIGLLEKSYVIKYGGHSDQTSRQYPAMDRFRIQSLTKILNAGMLSVEQTQAACAMLDEKLKIYREGALKRGKEKEVEDWLTRPL